MPLPLRLVTCVTAAGLVALLLTGCGEPGPESVAERYLQARKDRNRAELLELIPRSEQRFAPPMFPEGRGVEWSLSATSKKGNTTTFTAQIRVEGLPVEVERIDVVLQADGRLMVSMHRRALEADAANLSALIHALREGHEAGKPLPAARGRHFWIALVVGDGPDGPLTVSTEDESGQYISAARAARILTSPFDPFALTAGQINVALSEAITNGTGLTQLEQIDQLCSYAGPTNDDVAALLAYDGEGLSPIIAITATRNGASVIKEGFNAGRANGSTEFLSWALLASNWSWPSDVEVPQYGEEPLDHVKE